MWGEIIDCIRIADSYRRNCEGTQCLACGNKTKFSNCKKENIGYSLQRLLCKSRGIEKVYEGESCRNMYMRGKEHINQYKNNDPNSVLIRHAKTDHKDDEQDEIKFDMKLAGSFKTPLQRIINEGVRIKQREPDTLLNSKMEYFGPSVRRKNVT